VTSYLSPLKPLNTLYAKQISFPLLFTVLQISIIFEATLCISSFNAFSLVSKSSLAKSIEFGEITTFAEPGDVLKYLVFFSISASKLFSHSVSYSFLPSVSYSFLPSVTCS
jgi:hypothetical protein